MAFLMEMAIPLWRISRMVGSLLPTDILLSIFRVLTQPVLLHPSQLTRFRQVVDGIPGLGVQVLPITMRLVSVAAAISGEYGLLSGDALVVAVMREHGLVNLASHDADFDRVPGLTRYAPA